MALELLVAPAVYASVDFLLKKITSSDVGSFLRGKADSGFDRLLDKLEIMFLSLAEVLGDAEQKQIRNPRVEKWLDKLQEAVEDATDLFEEIEYDALKLKIESEPQKSTVSKFFSNFNLTDHKRKTEMEKILKRLDTFVKQRYILDIQADVEKIQSQKPPSISSIDNSEFFGRDDEKKILKRMLLSNEVSTEKMCVIPIVGLGGIGKTTLTQAVYNDDEVKKYFELRAWVCISDEFDVCKVMKTVLVAVTRDVSGVEDLSVLQEKIQEMLNKKKFLIVLDDVWNEEYSFWDTIKMLFNVGAQGSKIIVTTRSEKVALIVGTAGSHHLDVLKEEACFELFFKLVSRNEEFTTTNSNLERIGKELVKKCKGLPLAVKAVASLLCFTKIKEWKRIVESDILDSPAGEKNILPALRLSYYYLPSHLKRCFVYCSMFPKDYLFRKEELVLLWMVDHLLQHSSGNKTMKEVGYEYFDDLVSRSFFQLASGTYNSSVFVMHDLIVDLANHVSKKKFVYIEKGKRYDIGHVRQIRHIAFEEDINCHDFHETYKIISEAICLRTFMPVTKYYYLRLNTLHEDVLKDIMKLRRLRFLSLAGYENVSELPKSIGQLIHLHHLDLSYTSIKELPKSVCLLYNLQTLKLCGCKHLVKFPKNIHRLINLRYLYMSFCEFSTLPPLGQLPSLVTLLIEECASVEMVGLEFYGSSSSKSFPLLESLTLKRMSKWKEWSPPKANLEVFPKLTSLTIHRCEKLTGDLPWLLPSLTELDIFYCPKLASSLPVIPTITTIRVQHCAKIIGFKPCSNLQNFEDLEKLYLEGCSFKLLPLDSFPNIWNITIRNCESLESFSLVNSLKSLSTLSIQQCPNFTLNLDSNIHCPILTQLEFCSCHNLKFLPKNLSSLLPSLLELIILDCPNLESLPKFELPFNLRELTIRKCNKLIASRKNWNLQALPNLTSFCIGDYECEDMESFLEQGLLPTSLTSLKISGVACLKTLEEKGFQELKSLKELHIYMCPNLQSLPVKGLPPFFEGLLPPSFETFVMDYCPLLEKRYEWELDRVFGKKICCIPRSQVLINPQLLIKPPFYWFGPKVIVFPIFLILLCKYLYMYFSL